jgi:hypothetical protein
MEMVEEGVEVEIVEMTIEMVEVKEEAMEMEEEISVIPNSIGKRGEKEVRDKKYKI